jgi:hypothetical protein
MSSLTVSDVLEAFSPSLRSADLRVVAVKPEKHWINVITSMFLSCKSREEIESEQKQVRGKLLKDTSNFRILLGCFPFQMLPSVFEGFKSGEILIRRMRTKFKEIDPYELGVNPYHPNYLREIEEWKLVGSQAQQKIDDILWNIIERQNGQARLHGYTDIYQLISETLRIGDFHRGRNRGLVIGIPMPARIADVSLDGSSVKIKTKKDCSLKDLQLNLSLERVNPRNGRYEPVEGGRKIELVKKSKRLPTHEICHVTNSIQLTDLRPNDMIEVKLLHKKAPTLDMGGTRLYVPLENPVEPFARVLNAFCSMEIFRELLLNPERAKGKTRPNTIFENAVSWLLSLIGFSILPLGRTPFEHLRIPETGYKVGSVDIVAYRENECLLLIDCDTSMPDEKKIRYLKAVKDHFRFIQDEYKRLNIVSVIFTPRDCTGIPSDLQDVKIIDRHKIKMMFEQAMEGNSDQARSSLRY